MRTYTEYVCNFACTFVHIFLHMHTCGHMFTKTLYTHCAKRYIGLLSQKRARVRIHTYTHARTHTHTLTLTHTHTHTHTILTTQHVNTTQTLNMQVREQSSLLQSDNTALNNHFTLRSSFTKTLGLLLKYLYYSSQRVYTHKIVHPDNT